MTYWEKYISEEMTAAEKKKAAEQVLSDLRAKKKGNKKDKKDKKKKGDSPYQKYLTRQLEFKKQKYEDQKKRQIEKLKEKAKKESEGKVKGALSSIKYDTIGYKDLDPTAYKKAIGNVGSAAVALGKAGYEAFKSRKAKKDAEKKAAEAKSRQPEKKEPGKPGRPKSSGKRTAPTGESSAAPERRRLVPSTKRLPPASKKIAPSGGTPYQAPPAPDRETGMRLGQRARRNPALKSALIKSRMEEYSNWKEEFIFEVDDKMNKVEKKKVINIMKGTNKIELNPDVMEDHKEIDSGKKKDDEGYMANIELDQMERAIKALRKKVKKADTQLPAWVQSKITRAADYIDTASEYMQSDEKLSEEKEEKRYCKLCRKKEMKSECSYGPSMWEKYTISEMAPAIAALGRVALGAGARQGAKAALTSAVKDIAKEKVKRGVQSSLERAGQRIQSSGSGGSRVDPSMGGASAYMNALTNIVGEEVEISEAKKSEMKCNKPKAQAHGSGETGKSHIVKACDGGEEKLIRFGQLGVKGSPKKKGESEEYASRRNRFKTRHAKNIARGKMSAAYWADKVSGD